MDNKVKINKDNIDSSKGKSSIKEITLLFLKLGSTAFGGPAAHIAMMESEVVRKRKWMDHQHFLDLIGATNLIPGPNSSEMAMHCGHERGGYRGLLAAGAAFILPAVIITMLFAWLYSKYGTLPRAEQFIYGIKPAVVGIILYALYGLGKKAFKNNLLIALGVITLGVTFIGVGEITALFACGFAGVAIYLFKTKVIKGDKLFQFAPIAITPFLKYLFPVAVGGVVSISAMKIFLTFLKVGALLYGSGYVLFAFLDSELVSAGLLTREQLMDAVAVGQFTPGPVLSAATFVGWQLYGFPGAVAATLGIFLPSFLFVSLLNPLIPKMRKSAIVSAFMDAINVGSVAVIMAVVISMGRDAIVDWRSILILLISIFVAFKFNKLNSAFIVIGGSLLGYLLLLV
ncbi:MAG: chromate efflux transporter [Bacteroidales bacterium]|nr:chromate efflux transporter [Bacteroidales bacterium]